MKNINKQEKLFISRLFLKKIRALLFEFADSQVQIANSQEILNSEEILNSNTGTIVSIAILKTISHLQKSVTEKLFDEEFLISLLEDLEKSNLYEICKKY